uniref:Serine carboxypeptidase-like 31 n=1 Tax=Elaeis guineensis var. tenera TaxID=51953 RepID=A0A8N4EXA4_ELAGV|nr:serine carboxypeptidase-like 31 [Elaeis guineensis]
MEDNGKARTAVGSKDEVILHSNDTYTFLHNWLKKFPSYANRTFYIAGQTRIFQLWSLLYVPELAELIYDMNKKYPSLFINLKGFLVGNPETSDSHDWQGMVDYTWSHAIVSHATHDMIKDNCIFDSDNPWNNKCNDAVGEVLKQYLQSMHSNLHPELMPRIMGGYDPCLDGYTTSFYNRPYVQKALHASDGHSIRNWSICNNQIFREWKDFMPSVLPIYKKLIAGGLRIWVYNGDTDGRVPVLSTRYCLGALGLPTVGPWRPWYHEKQGAGWLQEHEELTFATFRGAGHDVPSFKPSSSLAFFTAFLAGVAPSSTHRIKLL